MRDENRIDQANQAVQRQFSAHAVKYVRSQVHAHGEDLGWLVEVASLTGSERVLDVGTGTGHAALALAPTARTVTGVDLTARMVESATSLAAERGVGNVQFVVSDVVRMPFPDAHFDLITCRLAAHHFADADAAAREIARVLRPGGRFILIDHVAPTDPDLDAFINRLDWLRDASHVREWTVPEWIRRFADVGIELEVAREWDLHLDYAWWIRQAGTPADRVAEIERMFADADPKALAAFCVEFDEADFSGSEFAGSDLSGSDMEGAANPGRARPTSFALKAVLLHGSKRG
ncbi:MAG: class I SAM-dependent methyltransferase [Alicyclobacillus sp.]|nr:class I SAM-dependent methyltransferase [Alicyclobacillus sp.]